jgi:hypothetical protein
MGKNIDKVTQVINADRQKRAGANFRYSFIDRSVTTKELVICSSSIFIIQIYVCSFQIIFNSFALVFSPPFKWFCFVCVCAISTVTGNELGMGSLCFMLLYANSRRLAFDELLNHSSNREAPMLHMN